MVNKNTDVQSVEPPFQNDSVSRHTFCGCTWKRRTKFASTVNAVSPPPETWHDTFGHTRANVRSDAPLTVANSRLSPRGTCTNIWDAMLRVPKIFQSQMCAPFARRHSKEHLTLNDTWYDTKWNVIPSLGAHSSAKFARNALHERINTEIIHIVIWVTSRTNVRNAIRHLVMRVTTTNTWRFIQMEIIHWSVTVARKNSKIRLPFRNMS